MSHDALLVGADAGVAAYAREPHPAIVVSLDDTRAQRTRPVRAADIAVEVASGERLTALQADWQALAARADCPNVFMNPLLVKLAGDADPGRRRVALLAWHERDGKRTLVGVWAFSIGRAPQSILPVNVLAAPAMAHGYLATPAIDRDALDAVFEAMLATIANDAGLPNIVALDVMTADGATMQALRRVLTTRGSAPYVLAEAVRPLLASEPRRQAILGKGALQLAAARSCASTGAGSAKRACSHTRLQRNPRTSNAHSKTSWRSRPLAGRAAKARRWPATRRTRLTPAP